MNSAQMMLKVISVFLSCRFISIAFASLVFITSTFANESILSIIKRQYGYGSIPFGVEYRRSIDGTFPENTNPESVRCHFCAVPTPTFSIPLPDPRLRCKMLSAQNNMLFHIPSS